MNPTELKILAATLNGIAEGKPWQFTKTEMLPHWYGNSEMAPIQLLADGFQIRLKPWELGRSINGHTLPEGASWHRQGFTEDMLLPTFRPLMLGEVPCKDDQFSRVAGKWINVFARRSDAVGPDDIYYRTTRPIRPIPLLTPEQIADGWLPWSGGECPVEPESRPTVMFRDLRTTNNEKALVWIWTWDLGCMSDIIAYKPDHYGKFRQALADGRTVEARYDDIWVTKNNTDFGARPPQFYRIKEPRWVKLGPEDVPPGSVFIGAGEVGYPGWCMAISCSITGIRLWGDSRERHWESLTEGQINRSLAVGKWDPNAWEPCRKLSDI